MGLRINTNLEALYAHRNVAASTKRLALSMERLSSGLRVNRSADDAAGLSISEKMRAQIVGLQQARRNSQDGISLLQTIDGALGEVHSILQRVRELCVQFNNSTYDDQQKQQIADELAVLSDEIGRIARETQFNGIPLLLTGTTMVTLQVGAAANEIINFALVTLSGSINSLTNPNDFFLLPFFEADLSVIDTDIDRVSQARAAYGAVQNRLEHAINQADQYEQNLLNAESRIRDTDMAKEMTNFTREQMLQESGMAMLSNAQYVQQSILKLLTG